MSNEEDVSMLADVIEARRKNEKALEVYKGFADRVEKQLDNSFFNPGWLEKERKKLNAELEALGIKSSSTKKPSPKWVQVLAGCVLIFLLYSCIASGPSTSPSPSTTAANTSSGSKEDVNPQLRVVQAERIVKEHLKDPKSASFRGLYYSGKAVCGEVNSKNSFGGYTGYQKFINRGRTVVLEGEPVFAAAWKEFC